jgi:very-short-patch-repair endonuclease
LVIEIDGSIHDNDAAKRDDADRQKKIESEGIKVLRFTNDKVIKQPETIISKIKLCCVQQINLHTTEGIKVPLQGAGGYESNNRL